MRIARSTLIGTAVAMALFGRNNVVQAQTSGDATTSNQNEQLQEVVVTGIRASLEQSIELTDLERVHDRRAQAAEPDLPFDILHLPVQAH